MTTLHPFERSNLGRAPFRCTGVTENMFRMPDGTAKPGGCCDHCYTGIRFEYHIASSDGKTFKVGSSCVEKTNREYGADAVANFRKVRLAHDRERRAAKTAITRAERQAKWDAERKIQQDARIEATAGWRAEHADIVSRLTGYTGDSSFVLSIKQALETYGNLTDRQLEVITNSFRADDATTRARTSSQHVGTVGQRIRGKVRITKVVGLGPTSFYPFVERYLIALEDDSGNALTWFTSNRESPFDEFAEAAYTVKEHSVYNGINQTIVQRVAFKD